MGISRPKTTNRKKYVIKTIDGPNYYDIESYYHMGLKEQFMYNLKTITGFNKRVPSDTNISPPFQMSSCGEIPPEPINELIEYGHQILEFDSEADKIKYLSDLGITKSKPHIWENDPFRIDLDYPWVARPYTVLRDIDKNYWYLDYTKLEISQTTFPQWARKYMSHSVYAVIKNAKTGVCTDMFYVGVKSRYTLKHYIDLAFKSQVIITKAWSFLDSKDMLAKLEGIEL